jgi:hypothetical protein
MINRLIIFLKFFEMSKNIQHANFRIQAQNVLSISETYMEIFFPLIGFMRDVLSPLIKRWHEMVDSFSSSSPRNHSP